jgi:hypothetical protein
MMESLTNKLAEEAMVIIGEVRAAQKSAEERREEERRGELNRLLSLASEGARVILSLAHALVNALPRYLPLVSLQIYLPPFAPHPSSSPSLSLFPL